MLERGFFGINSTRLSCLESPGYNHGLIPSHSIRVTFDRYGQNKCLSYFSILDILHEHQNRNKNLKNIYYIITYIFFRFFDSNLWHLHQ